MTKFLDLQVHLNSTLIQSLQLQNLLSQILGTLEKIVPASAGHSIILWNYETQSFDIGASTVKSQPSEVLNRGVRQSGGASRWVVDTGQIIVVENTEKDPFGANRLIKEYSIRAYVGVPLKYEDTVIGVLYNLSSELRRFEEHEIHTMQDFANLIAITIANIKMRQQIQTASKEIISARNQLEALFENLPDIVYVKDLEGRYQRVNRSSKTPFGLLSSDELLGKTDTYIYTPALAEQFYADDRKIIETETAIENQEEFHVYLNGREEWVLSSKIPLRNGSGELVGILGSIRSINSRKIAEHQREQLNMEQARIHILNQFINRAAHDLKTPLSVLKTTSYLLKRELNDSENPRLLTMDFQIARLTKLVDDMIYMSRLDNLSRLDLHEDEFMPILTTVVNSYLLEADARHQTLIFEGETLTTTIALNEQELKRAFSEIISNAVLHNPADTEIRVSVGETEHEILVQIADTGIGMSKESSSQIFQRGFRVDDARNSKTGGTGHGLAIAKRIVDLHGGRIELETNPGFGTIFRIFFPRYPIMPDIETSTFGRDE